MTAAKPINARTGEMGYNTRNGELISPFDFANGARRAGHLVRTKAGVVNARVPR